MKYALTKVFAKQDAEQNDAAMNAVGIGHDPLTGTSNCDWAFDKNGVKFSAAIDFADATQLFVHRLV